MYPFNHECQWHGPFYIWSSDSAYANAAPPTDCAPVYLCRICCNQRPAEREAKGE